MTSGSHINAGWKNSWFSPTATVVQCAHVRWHAMICGWEILSRNVAPLPGMYALEGYPVKGRRRVDAANYQWVYRAVHVDIDIMPGRTLKQKRHVETVGTFGQFAIFLIQCLNNFPGNHVRDLFNRLISDGLLPTVWIINLQLAILFDYEVIFCALFAIVTHM